MKPAWLLLALLAAAGDEPPLSAPDAWVPQHAARLRVLDKIQSTVETIDVGAGAAATVGAIRIAVGGCFIRPPDLPADAAARLTITEAEGGATLFEGWMLQREPAIGLLEHPVYDVQLAGCT